MNALSPPHSHPALRARLLFAAVAVSCLHVVTPAVGAGQAIRGTLVQKDTGEPIEGAAIVLLTEDERRLGWTLTNAAGRFFFPLSEGGRFFLRADRIGHVSTLSEVVELAASDTLVHRMEAAVEAIELVGLTVEGSSRDCRVRPGEGVATARVWEETRKALEAAARTSERAIYQFVLRRFERELDRDGRRVAKESSRVDRSFQRRPFRSLPVTSLVDSGFVQADGEGLGSAYYYAPDAGVLLSDEFLDTHCLRLREGEDEHEGLLGLEFEPTKARKVAEISGTLWLDPATAELQRLEYRYENLGFSVGNAPVGGTVVFAGLPNGTWFVSEWAIRMPQLGIVRPMTGSFRTRAGNAPRPEVIGIREEGARVLGVRDSAGRLLLEAESGTITGVVLNNIGTEPMEGAIVSVVGTDTQVITGADGTFRITQLGSGFYDLRTTHPILSSLGHQGTTTSARAVSGEVKSVQVFLESRVSVLAAACRNSPSDGGGVAAGWVQRAGTGERVANSLVELRWSDFDVAASTLILESPFTLQVTAREDGFFIACGLPLDTAVEIEAVADGMAPTTESVRFGYDGEVVHPVLRLSPGTGS